MDNERVPNSKSINTRISVAVTTNPEKRTPLNLEESLQILRLSTVDLGDFGMGNSSSCVNADSSLDLEKQRRQAKKSLNRAAQTGLPAKYLVQNYSASSVLPSNDSTISDSDLLATPTNTSTPRSSEHRPKSRKSYGDLLATPTNKSNVRDFKQHPKHQVLHSSEQQPKTQRQPSPIRNSTEPNCVGTYNSSFFTPGEEAANMLAAAELLWRNQNVLQSDSCSTFDFNPQKKSSISDFFQQHSVKNISLFSGAVSPPRAKSPVALVDETCTSISSKFEAEMSGLSEIQKMITDTQSTPHSAAEHIFNNWKKKSQSAYTGSASGDSDFSDNEAIKTIAEKENRCNTLNIPKQQTASKLPSPSKSSLRSSHLSSCRSTSSALTNLPGGKLPIDSDRSELVWGCVKVGKSESCEFRLRNRSSKKVGLQMVSTEQEFKIRKENRLDSEPLNYLKVVLQPNEVKTFVISFIPTRNGAAVGQLVFTPIDSSLTQTGRQLLKLWGYGGYSKIELRNLSHDIAGKYWLSLGVLRNKVMITEKFIVKNVGVLPAFFHLSLRSNHSFKVTVTPSFFTLISQEQKEVSVTYIQNSADRRELGKIVTSSMVGELGTLIVTSGAEATRGRLRQMCKKSVQNNLELDDLSKSLQQIVNGEVIPEDVARFHEHHSSIKQILRLFDQKEIIITVALDLDETIIPEYLDESVMFQSLCQD